MANELNLYRVKHTLHRRRLDRKTRQKCSGECWIVGANPEEAVRKRLAQVREFDRPTQGWTTVSIEATSVEQVGTLRRCAQCGEFRADEHRILCVCNGRCCERCGERKMHRPVSDYYDEWDGHLWHVPWFCTPRLCRDCDPVDRLKVRAWAAVLHVEPRARPHGDYHVLDTFFAKQEGRALPPPPVIRPNMAP